MAFASAIIGVGVALAQQPGLPQPGQVIVQVIGLRSATGLLHYALFAESEEFLSRSAASHRGEIPIDRLDFSFQINDVKPGVYALVVAHDVDGDGQIDTPSLFRPFAGEPAGVSNYRQRLYGRPEFERAKIVVGPEGLFLQVRLFATAIF